MSLPSKLPTFALTRLGRWSIVSLLLAATPLAAGAAAPPDPAELRLGAQRGLAERNGRPIPADPVWADELEGRRGRSLLEPEPTKVTVAKPGRAVSRAVWAGRQAPQEREVRERPAARAAAARSQIAGRRALGPAATTDGTASLAGRVVRASDGTGAAGLGVFLYDWDTELFYEATTAADGSYTFGGIEAGLYDLWTTGSDHLTGANYGGGPCFVDYCGFASELIEVAEGAALAGYELEVDPADVVTGSVVGRERGTGTLVPQAGLTVECVTYSVEDRFYVQYTSTEADGSFRFAGVPAGAWWLIAGGNTDYVGILWPDIPCTSSGCFDGDEPTSFEAVGDEMQGGFDFVLEAGRNIVGRVTRAADGSPIEGVFVEVYDTATGDYQGGGWSDADGNYRSQALPPGTYEALTWSEEHFAEQIWDGQECVNYYDCLVRSGDPIEVGADADRAGVDFALRDPATIAGRLVRASDGQPVHGWVDVYTSGGSFVVGVESDDEGHYATAGLGAGSYALIGYDQDGELIPQLWNGHPCVDFECDLADGDPVVAVNGETVIANFAFASPVLLSGTVTGETLDGSSVPIAFALVTVKGEAGGSLGSFLTDNDGSWSVVAAADTFRVSFSRSGFRAEVFDGIPCATAGCDLDAGTPIVLAAGEERTDIDARLELGGVLAGQITVKASGAVVRGATVDVYRETGPGAYSYQGSVSSGSGGRWQATGLIPGTYKVRVRPGSKYRPMLYQATSCDFLLCSVGIDGVAIPLAESERRLGIDMAVARSVVIEGRVRADASGRGIKGGGVRLWDLEQNRALFGGVTQHGGYRIGSLPPGRYLLSVVADADRFLGEVWPGSPCPGHECYGSGEVLELGAPGIYDGYDFSLGPAAIVTGTVRDAETGEGLANAVVIGMDQGIGLIPGFAFTDAQGRYRMGGLAPGPLLLGVMSSSEQFGFDFGQAAADYVDTFLDGKTCPEFNCDPRPLTVLTLEAGRRDGVVIEQRRGVEVRGTAVNPDGSGANGTVRLLDLAGTSSYVGFASADGAWSIGAVLPGRYYLHVASSGRQLLYPGQTCAIGSCDLGQGELLEVGDADVEVDVTLGAAAVGVIDARVVVGPRERPRGGGTVTLYDAAGKVLMSITSRRTGDFVGQALFTGLAPGDYLLRARAGGWVAAMYPDVPCSGSACDPTTGTPITVDDSGGVVTVTVHLAQPEVVLRGEVVDAEGAPLTGLFVSGYDAEGNSFGAGGVEWDGSYRIDELPAGLLLQATSWNGADWMGELRDDVFCSRDACDWSAGEPVEVEPGDEVTGLDFVLSPGASLGGQVLEADTLVPLGGVEVEVRTADGVVMSGPFTNPDGFWQSTGLPPGRYVVRTIGTVGYLDVTLGGEVCDPDCPEDQGNVVLLTEPGRFGGFDLVLQRE